MSDPALAAARHQRHRSSACIILCCLYHAAQSGAEGRESKALLHKVGFLTIDQLNVGIMAKKSKKNNHNEVCITDMEDSCQETAVLTSFDFHDIDALLPNSRVDDSDPSS